MARLVEMATWCTGGIPGLLCKVGVYGLVSFLLTCAQDIADMAQKSLCTSNSQAQRKGSKKNKNELLVEHRLPRNSKLPKTQILRTKLLLRSIAMNVTGLLNKAGSPKLKHGVQGTQISFIAMEPYLLHCMRSTGRDMSVVPDTMVWQGSPHRKKYHERTCSS
eukprot:186602-Pelagomonas_calceolata.AAC.2